MKIVLATGIYPPDIGGPATYAHALAKDLNMRKVDVTVITYVHRKFQVPSSKFQKNLKSQIPSSGENWEVVKVSKRIPILRWFLYARALKRVAKDADSVIAFSSVSAGVPVKLARLKKPKKILRLGGDFLWERYTARGGMRGLGEWHKSFWFLVFSVWLGKLLMAFDRIVFSTEFQRNIYLEHYKKPPDCSVIENAMPKGNVLHHEKSSPFRLLFMGRFVGFKNLPVLLQAVSEVDDVTLKFVGDGPVKNELQKLATTLGIQNRVSFSPPLHGEEKIKAFAEHDLLVIPSITEISPNVALEARANGLLVLLTEKTGLSEMLIDGMVVRNLSTPGSIKKALEEVIGDYDSIALKAASEPTKRGWDKVANEWISQIRND